MCYYLIFKLSNNYQHLCAKANKNDAVISLNESKCKICVASNVIYISQDHVDNINHF